MKTTFDQHIGVFEDAIPKEWCEKVIKVFDSYQQYSINRQDEGADTTQKKDLALPLHKLNPQLALEFNKNFWPLFFEPYIQEYQFKILLDNPVYINDYKIQQTLPTGGYHVWHAEHGDSRPELRNRMLVYTIYLNDVEEGGETEFLIQSKRVKPKQGTMCLFPTYYTHIHRGNPPLSGVKYIMTGWVSYDNETVLIHPFDNE